MLDAWVEFHLLLNKINHKKPPVQTVTCVWFNLKNLVSLKILPPPQTQRCYLQLSVQGRPFSGESFHKRTGLTSSFSLHSSSPDQNPSGLFFVKIIMYRILRMYFKPTFNILSSLVYKQYLMDRNIADGRNNRISYCGVCFLLSPLFGAEFYVALRKLVLLTMYNQVCPF